MRQLLGAMLAATAIACGSPDRPPPSTTGGTAATPAASPQPPIPQWPAAANADQRALGAMSAAASSQVGESPVPVLVPTDRQVLAASRVLVGDSRYTFASSTNGLTVSVQASAAPKESPASVAPNPAALTSTIGAGSRRVSITENEGIRVATWFENGVAYSADVECATTTDARCKDNAYLLALVRDLVFVGGRPR